MAKYRLSLTCGKRDECLELLEAITHAKGVRANIINGEIRGGKIIITITGNEVEVHQSRRAIIKTYREWREFRDWFKGRECININNLIKQVGKPFPSDALIEALRLTGWKAKLVGGNICTNADREYLINLSIGLARALDSLIKLKPKASYTAKCLVTVLAILTNMSVHHIMNELINEGILIEEGPRLTVSSEWRSLLRKLIGSWRGQERGASDKEENR